MNSTFKIAFASSLFMCLLGCKTFVQIVDMKPTEGEIIDLQTHYVFDNDTVRIAYHFWGDNGNFWFEIQNRLKVPIYIDWKKSNVVINNTPYPYWDDNKEVNTLSVGKGYGASAVRSDGITVSAGIGGSISKSVITAKERVTFLSPGAVVNSRTHQIAREEFILAKEATEMIVPHDAKPKKSTTVYSQEFPSNPPIRLTNFITLSLKESFEQEFFISNSFKASRIREMDTKHFLGKPVSHDENFNYSYEPSLRNQQRFYMVLPEGNNHKSYWRSKK